MPNPFHRNEFINQEKRVENERNQANRKENERNYTNRKENEKNRANRKENERNGANRKENERNRANRKENEGNQANAKNGDVIRSYQIKKKPEENERRIEGVEKKPVNQQINIHNSTVFIYEYK